MITGTKMLHPGLLNSMFVPLIMTTLDHPTCLITEE